MLMLPIAIKNKREKKVYPNYPSLFETAQKPLFIHNSKTL